MATLFNKKKIIVSIKNVHGQGPFFLIYGVTSIVTACRIIKRDNVTLIIIKQWQLLDKQKAIYYN